MTGVRGSRLQAGKRNSGATGSARPTPGVDSMHRPYQQDALPFLGPTNYLCLNKFLCFYPQIFLKSQFFKPPHDAVAEMLSRLKPLPQNSEELWKR